MATPTLLDRHIVEQAAAEFAAHGRSFAKACPTPGSTEAMVAETVADLPMMDPMVACHHCRRRVAHSNSIPFGQRDYCPTCVVTCPNCTVDVPRFAAVRTFAGTWVCKICWRYAEDHGILPTGPPIDPLQAATTNLFDNNRKLEAWLKRCGFWVVAPATKDKPYTGLTWADIMVRRINKLATYGFIIPKNERNPVGIHNDPDNNNN